MKSFEEKKISALKQASDKIIQLKKELERAKLQTNPDLLAVVGMGCHFPGGAHSPEAYWRNLEAGVDAIIKVPKDRWDSDAYFSSNPDEPGKINSKYGGFLTSDLALFDAAFFEISPTEADAMNPQQRLVLEVTWQALEYAGIRPQSLHGEKAGVYIGTSTNDYAYLFTKQVSDQDFNAYYGSGNSPSVLPGRVAYILGLNGPAIACDTACSSSLVAVDLACTALANGEINLAIAGGVNLIFSPQNSISFSKARLLSEDGHCKSFDYRADGYSRGEGCGVIVVKRLKDALKDHDRIICLIKSTAVNHNGDSSGLTTPNASAQEHVIRQALEKACLKPSDIDVIEAHGAGTALGDSIEMEAIGTIFSGRASPLSIGSVKTNIGHLDSAAGIAGLIKMILSLQHQKIPKHLNFTKINPLINLKPFNGEIPCETQNWPKKDNRIRRAGISAFGLNGTNAHVILEESPSLEKPVHPPRARYLFCFSAKTQDALDAYLDAFHLFLSELSIDELDPADLSFTLNACRDQYRCRLAIIATSVLDLKHQIQNKNFFKLNTNDLNKKPLLEEQIASEFIAGKELNFDELYLNPTQKISLPNYVFQKKRHWQPKALSSDIPPPSTPLHPLLRNQVDSPRHHESLFTTLLSSTSPAFVADYKVHHMVVLSGASHLSTVLSYLVQILKKDGGILSDLRFEQPLIIENQNPPFLQFIVNRQSGAFEMVSYKQQALTNLTTHFTGSVIETNWEPHSSIVINKLHAVLHKKYPGMKHLENAQKRGLSLGPNFHWIEKISYNRSEILATLRHAFADEEKGDNLFPGLMDACFQAMMVWSDSGIADTRLYLPQRIDKLFFSRFKALPRYVYIKRDQEDIQQINLLDEQGRIVLQMTGLVFKELTRPILQEMQEQQYKNIVSAYKIDWIKLPPHAFDRAELNQELLELLVINPRKYAYGKSDSSKLSFRQEEEVPATIDVKHVVYIYPQESASDEPQNLYHLHQGIQKLLDMSIIESIGIIVAPGLYHAMVEGYWKTLCLEHQEKTIYFIESVLQEEMRLGTLIRAQCLKECPDQHLAIREGAYYVPRMVNLNHFEDKNQKPQPMSLSLKESIPFHYKKDKTYLITGGLGQLGKLLIAHLVRQGVKHLVLIGRKPVETLPKWIADLKNQEVSIHYITAQVSDLAAMNAMIAEINSSTATLAGIFHLAGIFKDKSIDKLSPADFDLIFEAKIKGTVALHQATRALKLDCFVLFSSIASIFGSLGQANYSAANRFMDAFCQERRDQGLAALSINWGPFRRPARDKNHFSAFEAAGLVPLNAVDAFVTMDLWLNKPDAQIIIADFKWEEMAALGKKTPLLALLNKKDEPVNPSSFVSILKNTAKEKRAALLTAALKEIVSASFSIRHGQDIHEHKEFMEFGVDSLMTITLWNRLQTMVGPEHNLPKEIIMECTNIFKLSDYFKQDIFPEYFDIPVKSLPKVKHMTGMGPVVMPKFSPSSFDDESKIAYGRKKKENRVDGAIDDIFLTGATGVLGSYLTKIFLEETKTTLHCLIRAHTPQEGLHRLSKVLKTYNVDEEAFSQLENRVKIYCGDVSCDHFSLTPDDYCNLIGVTDLIIHSAEKNSLGESFEELYDTNLLGTKNIIHFALKTESKSLLYVSSYSVMGDIQMNKDSAFKETDFDLGQGFGDLGYQKTKFESERAIRMAESKGLNWRIVRRGNVFGDAVANGCAFGSKIKPNPCYDLLKTITETNLAFISPLYFDITPVSYVAKAIVHITYHLQSCPATYHLTNPDIQRFSKIIKILRDLGFPIEAIAMNDYIQRIYTHQLKHHGKVYQSLTTSLIQSGATRVIPMQSTPVDAHWTHEILVKAGIQCPKIDMHLLSALLSHCMEHGYISAQRPAKDTVVI